MIDELYIDGQKADLSDTGISLTYQSTIFSELSKIVSNYSYTIKLPKTDRNIKLIEGAIYPSSNSRYPYLVHSGMILRDGVRIVDKANVVILKIREEIELSLTWGTSSVLSQLINDGASLTDLPITDSITAGETQLGSERTPIIDWGSQDDVYNVFDHPVIYTHEIISKIKEKYNVTINFPVDISQYINRIMIPLTKEEGYEANIEKFSYTSNISKQNGFIYQTNGYPIHLYEIEDNPYYERTYTATNIGDRIKFKDKDLEMTFVVDATFNAKTEGGNDIHDYACRMFFGSNGIITPTKTYTDNNNAVLRYVGTVKCAPDYAFHTEGHTSLVGYELVSGTVRVIPDIDYLKKGSLYPFLDNLPDVKITDFLKTIKTMFGLYARASDNNIYLEKYDSIYDIENAEDWSDRLVNYITGKCDIDFHSDLAQKNNFTYKNDEVVNPENDGTILINDKTLDAEDEAFTSVFEASENVPYLGQKSVRIPIYSKDESGDVEYNDVNPRILAQAGQLPNSVVGTFGGLQWPNLINKYYQRYIEMMTDAKYVTVDMIITPIELKEVNLYRPIYLKQYGCYFAITEIKTGDNNICSVTLIKL